MPGIHEGGFGLAFSGLRSAGGKIAMLGSRLVDSAAKSLVNQFFDKFAAVVKKDGKESRGKSEEKTSQALEALKLQSEIPDERQSYLGC